MFQKTLHVFNFDPGKPTRFTKTRSNTAASGLLPPISANTSEEEVRAEIVAIVKSYFVALDVRSITAMTNNSSR